MTRFFLLGHHEREEVPGLVTSLQQWAKGGGHEVWMSPADAAALQIEGVGSDRPAGEANLVIALGGDGTVLRAVQMLDGRAVPILAVNVGTLGYLTEVSPDDLVKKVVKWMTGKEGVDFFLDRRMMLRAELVAREGRPTVSWRAVNEVVLEKQTSGHTIWLDLAINGEKFARYSADGLIVATPTGSTAYSLSARGPLVSPRHRALLVTPVSPHMLFDRSLVLDSTESVHIQVVGSRAVDVAIDGRKVASLGEDDEVRVVQDDGDAVFVRFQIPHFHSIVRQKLGLGEY
jgi:NAD+ kinase